MEPLVTTTAVGNRPAGSKWLVDLLRLAGIVFFANYTAALLTHAWEWLGLYGVPGSYQLDISDGLLAAVPWLAVGAAGGWLAASTADSDRRKFSVIVLALLITCQHLLSGAVWRITAHSIEVFPLGAAVMSGAGALLGGVLQRRKARRGAVATDRTV